MQVMRLWDFQQWDGADRHNHKCYVEYNNATENLHEQMKNHKQFKYDAFILRDLVVLRDSEELEEYMSGEAKRKAKEVAMHTLTREQRKLLNLDF